MGGGTLQNKKDEVNDITAELARLKTLRGSDFVGQLKFITSSKAFHALLTDPDIYVVGGETTPTSHPAPTTRSTARSTASYPTSASSTC